MLATQFEFQPLNLRNELINLEPLQNSDFEKLFKVASDPEIWAQHPNQNRYERSAFQNFFKGAMDSGGAFLIQDQNKEIIGSSRFYDFKPIESSVHIGYTFLAKKYWGKGYNKTLKSLMLHHAFKFVDKVIFHVGSNNIPSQKAMNKLGAIKTGEIEVAYYGEPVRKNFIYEIAKKDWNKLDQNI